MSIDARIAAVKPRKDGAVLLHLASYRHSDGARSIPGVRRLAILSGTRRPLAGQRIWGNAGECIVEAGNGGERIEYKRVGMALYEKESKSDEQRNG